MSDAICEPFYATHEVHELVKAEDGWQVICICGTGLNARRTVMAAYREMEDHLISEYLYDTEEL